MPYEEISQSTLYSIMYTRALWRISPRKCVIAVALCSVVGSMALRQGLDDLRNGIIRTPLSPMETFHDDPLRVIRCIRFASRFGFDFVPELRDAALHPEIQVSICI